MSVLVENVAEPGAIIVSPPEVAPDVDNAVNIPATAAAPVVDSAVVNDPVQPPPPPPPSTKKVKVSRQLNVEVDSSALAPVVLTNPNEVLVQQIYDTVKKYLNGQSLTQSNAVAIVGIAMRTVQTIKKGLTTADKKSIVMYTIQRLVGELDVDSEVKSYFTDIFIPLLLSDVIESLCELNVHVVMKTCLPCCGSK
jgi:hypothetical protein